MSSCRCPTARKRAVLEIGGWDSHASRRAAAGGAVQQCLKLLDATLRTAPSRCKRAQPAPGHAVVRWFTEFDAKWRSSSARRAPTTAAAARLQLGGAVRGGRVIADWFRALAPKDRFEGRDTAHHRPTCARCSKPVLHDHLGVAARRFDASGLPAVFPRRKYGRSICRAPEQLRLRLGLGRARAHHAPRCVRAGDRARAACAARQTPARAGTIGRALRIHAPARSLLRHGLSDVRPRAGPHARPAAPSAACSKLKVLRAP